MAAIRPIVKSHEGVAPVPAVPIGRCDQRVNALAMAVFKKVALGFAVNGLLIVCGVTPFSVMLLTSCAAVILLDCIIHFAVSRILFGEERTRLSRLNAFGNLLFVNGANLAAPITVMHEAGHALAASCLLKDAKPHIHFKPFRGGYTAYSANGGLSRLGALLGGKWTIVTIALAGIGASTLCAMVEFALAYFTEDSHPTLAHFLRCHGVSELLNEILYGLSSLVESPENITHDFIRMQFTGGIHPILPVLLMVLLPLTEVIVLPLLWAKAFPERAEAGEAAKMNPLVHALRGNSVLVAGL